MVNSLNNINTIKKTLINMYLIFIVLSLSSIGIIAYSAYLIDMPIFKLWKELYIFIMFVISLYIMIKYKIKNIIKLTMAILSIYFVWILYSLSLSSIHQIIYQIKIDGFNIIFFIVSIVVFFTCIDKNDRKYYLNKIFKIIIIFSIINTIIVIFQGLFSNLFVTRILGLEWGAWSRDYGISVVIADEKLRAFGLMNNYISAGELLVISIILIIEGKGIFNIDKRNKMILVSLFIIGIYFTTYKTAYLWIAFYATFKLVTYIIRKSNYSFIKNNYIKTINISLVFSTIGLLILQCVITNTLFLYSIIEKLVPKFAYSSVYMRVIFHKDTISRMDSILQKIFGLGMGMNGLFVGKVDNNIYNTIPLDSNYIYIMSNYGFLGLILYILILVSIMALSIIYNDKDEWGIKYLISYLLCVQFFFNNLSTSIPISYIVIIFISVFLSNIKHLIVERVKG